MSVTLTIHITKEVLQQSAKCHKGIAPTNCAIAVAIRHIWPNAIICGMDENYFDTKNRAKSFAVPDAANSFIYDFDNASEEQRLEMQPFSFDISVPDEVINSINIDELLKLGNTVTKKEVAA